MANATIVYNDGEQAREKLYEHLGLKPGPYTKYMYRVIDRRRVLRSICANVDKIKAHRKEMGINRSKTVDCADEEYVPGGY